MNLNIMGYALFLAIAVYIIVAAGKACYHNGNIFVLELIPDHEALCRQINKILLAGYYLVNIGYCAMTLVSWKAIADETELIEVISAKSAAIIGILAVLHYLNIFLLTNYVQKLIK
ncbi:MAG TPA: hypothetical protein VFR70_03320 [Flavobacterium sp.]|nr:hypothetical protein [Flavobacterium sp.]